MNSFLSGFALLCVLAGFLSLMVWDWTRANRILEARKAAARQQFDAWLASPAAAKLHVGTANAEPVLVYEYRPSRDNDTGNYSLTWYLRNAKGQYLMLLSTENEKPFVKLIEDRYARVVLKSRYQSPN